MIDPLGYESHELPLAPPHVFVARVVRNVIGVAAVMLLSLTAGMAGFHWLEGLGWIDAFLNAAMLLGGMGPVDVPRSDAGKLFAGLYALYCGLFVLIAAGIVLAPVAHRLLHRFHLQQR